MLSVSYDLTDNGRLHVRWAQAARFPSIYEATTVNSSWTDAYDQAFDLKPERSTNWEIGYTYNFAPRFKKLRSGDIRLTYYNSTIKNAIELSQERNLQQYDRRITRGLELQSRIDSGKWFATLGANYRLKQVVCDKAATFNYDAYVNRVPRCIEGGFGATRFHQSRQPKYSVNLDIGTRRFNEKLELGIRGIYHSKAENKQQDALAQFGYAGIFESTGRPYYWRSATVFDAYGRYRAGKHLELNFSITNLTDRYYLDPMSNVPVAAPAAPSPSASPANSERATGRLKKQNPILAAPKLRFQTACRRTIGRASASRLGCKPNIGSLRGCWVETQPTLLKNTFQTASSHSYRIKRRVCRPEATQAVFAVQSPSENPLSRHSRAGGNDGRVGYT